MNLHLVLHCIIFHRSFQTIKPTAVDIDSLNLTYAKIDDPFIEDTINKKVALFTEALKGTSPKHCASGRVGVLFYEKTRGASGTWFTGANNICWEQWIINIKITQALGEKEEIRAKKQLENDILQLLHKISDKTMESLDHIPSLTSNDPFPFQIVIMSKSDQSWTQMLKQMIS